MTIAHTLKLPIILVTIAALGAPAAMAEQFRLVPADGAQSCQGGEKSDEMALDAPRDINLAREDSDKANVAVCVADNSKSAVNVRWRANGYWYSSGNVTHGCAEILGASKVKLRSIGSNFHDTATYYTCIQR